MFLKIKLLHDFPHLTSIFQSIPSYFSQTKPTIAQDLLLILNLSFLILIYIFILLVLCVPNINLILLMLFLIIKPCHLQTPFNIINLSYTFSKYKILILLKILFYPHKIKFLKDLLNFLLLFKIIIVTYLYQMLYLILIIFIHLCFKFYLFHKSFLIHSITLSISTFFHQKKNAYYSYMLYINNHYQDV